MFKKYKITNFTERINAFRVIERLERMNILGGQNNESVNVIIYQYIKFLTFIFKNEEIVNHIYIYVCVFSLG